MHGVLISRDKLIFMLEPIFMGLYHVIAYCYAGTYIHASEITTFSTGTYIHGALISRDKLIFMSEPIFMRVK